MGQVMGDGALAGLTLGGVIAALPGTGEPGLRVSGTDVPLWLALLGTLGSVNALLVYLISTPSHSAT
jgi:hypothetical protein